jgi:hypothetical protein
LIYVSALSPSPERSVEIVDRVLDRARQELAAQQNSLRVPKQTSIHMESFVDATPPKLNPGASIAVTGVVLLLGLVITATVACVADRCILTHRARRAHGGITLSEKKSARTTMSAMPRESSSDHYTTLAADIAGKANGVPATSPSKRMSK